MARQLSDPRVECIKFVMKEIREFEAPKNHYQSSDIIYSELFETYMYLSFLYHAALKKNMLIYLRESIPIKYPCNNVVEFGYFLLKI